MPRTPKGGTRAGAPGTAYTNRTDLNANRSLPVRTAPGQTWGSAQAQAEAQRMVPMRPQPGTAPQPVAGPPQAPQQAPIGPGGFGPIDRPTERPTEPLMAGAPRGPGPGPAAIPQFGPTGQNNTNLSSMLAQIARTSQSQAVQSLAQRAAAAGQ